jgi:hypothetical protein
MNRRTGAANGVADRIMNRLMNIADPKMLGGRCRASGAENNRIRKRNFCLAEHFSFLPIELLPPKPKLVGGGWATQDETANRLPLFP